MPASSRPTTRPTHRAGFLLTLLVLAACQGQDDRSPGVLHPVDRLLAYPLEPSSTVDLRSSRPVSGSSRAGDYFRAGSDPVRIGTLDGARETVFGKVQDLAVDARGNLYVLDQRYNEVRVFDSSNRYQYSIGKAGRGPGELYSPQAITVDSAGRLYVADVPGVIHVFDPTPNGLAYRETLNVEIGVLDMCAMGDALYVNGTSSANRHVIHQFDLQGKPVRSFGRIYRSDDPMVNFQLARGHLACIPEERMVAFVPASILPVVIGYRADGSAAWVSRFAGYRPVHLTQTANGSSVDLPEDGFNQVDMVSYLPSGSLLVQVATRLPNPTTREPELREIRSYAFSIRSGEGSFVSSTLPLIGLADRKRFVSTAEDPYPTITIHGFAASR